MDDCSHVNALEMLHKDHYRPEELAALLQINVSVVREAAFAGQLRAEIVNHHVLSIRREDALAWLAEAGDSPASTATR